MSTQDPSLDALLARGYQHGFVTDIESDTVAPGLDRGTVRFISAKKGEPQFLLDWRLRALDRWYEMKEPHWAKLHYKPIDYQDISYYSAPKAKTDGPKSLADVDPKLLATYEKLGVPLHASGRRSCRCCVRQRVGRHHLQRSPLCGRSDLLSVLRGSPKSSRAD